MEEPYPPGSQVEDIALDTNITIEGHLTQKPGHILVNTGTCPTPDQFFSRALFFVTTAQPN